VELEVINRLFLELSQFTTAKTARELCLEQRCTALVQAVKRLTSLGESPANRGSRLILTADVDELEELAEEASIVLAGKARGPVDASYPLAYRLVTTGDGNGNDVVALEGLRIVDSQRRWVRLPTQDSVWAEDSIPPFTPI
jgi:hypothetical protein